MLGSKTTVEECLMLDVRVAKASRKPYSHGVVSWWTDDQMAASMSYIRNWADQTPSLALRYSLNDAEVVRQRINLVSTTVQNGGTRWWFQCPIIVEGFVCRRRCSKLYLPDAQKYFGCRTCHDLSYQSSQQAHYIDRMEAELGLPKNALGFSRKKSQVR